MASDGHPAKSATVLPVLLLSILALTLWGCAALPAAPASLISAPTSTANAPEPPAATDTQLPAPRPAVTVAARLDAQETDGTAACTICTLAAGAILRQGPGTRFAGAGPASAGERVEVIGCTADGDWCQLAGGEWVFSEFLKCGAGLGGCLARPTPIAEPSPEPAAVVPTPTELAELAEPPTAMPETPSRSGAIQPPGCISCAEAQAFVGQRRCLCGPVVRANNAANSRGAPTFLDLDEKYPSPRRCEILIWGNNRANFPEPPETAYRGKRVCVTGVLVSYNGILEIEARSQADIVEIESLP